MILNFARATVGVATFAGMIAYKFYPDSALSQIFEQIFVKEGPIKSAMLTFVSGNPEHAAALAKYYV